MCRLPFLVIVVCLVGLSLVGCASDDPSDAATSTTAVASTAESTTTTGEPSTTTTTEAATTTEAVTTTQPPVLAEGSGSGDDVVQFSVASAASVATFTHDGTGAFSVWELDDDLEPTSLLIDTTGTYQGTRPLWDAASLGGVSITADGDWSFTVVDFDYARHEECPINGNGDDVVVLLDLRPTGFGSEDATPIPVDITFDGDTALNMWVYGWVSPQHILDTTGPYEGTVEVVEGMIIWDITANGGAWTITCSRT